MIPERLQGLPRDPRGYIIPYIVLRDTDGRPHYTINDTRLRDRCLYQHLCPICGKALFRGRWFLGGPGSAFHPLGRYIDTPMHFECMRYAVETCPYIASVKYGGRIDNKTLDLDKMPPGLSKVTFDPTMDPDRPKVFVALMAIGQEMLPSGPLESPHVRPNRPYKRVEFWRHGRQIDEATALEFFDDDIRNHYMVSQRGLSRRQLA